MRNYGIAEYAIFGGVIAFLLIMCMTLSEKIFDKMGQEAFMLVFVIIGFLVIVNIAFGAIIGDNVLSCSNASEIIVVITVATSFSVFVNYSALMLSDQMMSFFYHLGIKYFNNKISVLALFLIIQAIMANIVCFVIYNKPNYAILEYSEEQPKKLKKTPVFDKNNRQIKEGDTVEISDEDMQQIQNKFKWFAREMIADFEADLNKKIVIKKYIFEVTKGSDYTTTGLLLKKDNKTEVLYDDISKYCKIVSNNL